MTKNTIYLGKNLAENTALKVKGELVNFDNEVLQYLSVRKDELIESHEEYV